MRICLNGWKFVTMEWVLGPNLVINFSLWLHVSKLILQKLAQSGKFWQTHVELILKYK